MLNRLNKAALVTGSAKGIGKAIALQLAEDGYDIIINYMSSEDKAEETRVLCENLGVKAVKIRADVSDEKECVAMFAKIKETFGGLDVLVNNAGITKDNLIIRMSGDDFEKIVDVNLKSAFYCMKNASKLMIKNRTGKIISISSIVGLRGNAGQVNYSASKAGLIGMTKSLAKELASRGIRVNAVAPGFVDTDMTKVLSDDVKEVLLSQIPLGKLGDVSDIANTVSFLASEKSRYMTGQVLSVDGGMNI